MSVKDRIIEAWDDEEFLNIHQLAEGLDVSESYARRVIREAFTPGFHKVLRQPLQPGHPEVELRKAAAAREGVSMSAIRVRISRHGREKALFGEFRKSKGRAA